MPLRRLVPDLTDLVYLPICVLIKREALKVSHNCITKFQLDYYDEIQLEISNDSNQYGEMDQSSSDLEILQIGNDSRPSLGLEKPSQIRYIRIFLIN